MESFDNQRIQSPVSLYSYIAPKVQEIGDKTPSFSARHSRLDNHLAEKNKYFWNFFF